MYNKLLIRNSVNELLNFYLNTLENTVLLLSLLLLVLVLILLSLMDEVLVSGRAFMLMLKWEQNSIHVCSLCKVAISLSQLTN